MFMGQHSDEVKLKINNILSKQKLALEILDVNKDVIYHTTYHERFADATFHTKPNAFFLEKLKKNEPFINAYVNPIVDLRKINKYDFSQLKEFISHSLIHELHHATNEHAPDHIYASYLNSSCEPKVKLNGLLELTVPHLRSENIFSAKNDTLKLYYYYATQEERIMFGSIKHTAKEAEINQKLKEAINKKIEESDKQVLENPDSLVFLIRSLYDAVKNNHNFKRLVIDYDRWFNGNEESVFVYLKSNDIHTSQHKLRHNSIGELNSGSLMSLTSSIRDYKIKQSNPIDIKFEYVIKGPEAANCTLKSNCFADEKALSTTKGSSLSVKTVIERITEEKNKLDLGKNLNFIKVSCNEEQAVGIKVLKSRICYGKPLLIFSKKYGISTVVHAVGNSSIDAYYVSKSLKDSTKELLEIYNILNPRDIIHTRHISNSHLTIKQFFTLLSSKYNKVSVHFSGRDMTENLQEILSPSEINKIELFQYDKNIMDSTDNIPFGQSFLLLSRTIDGKAHINSYSESFDLLKDGHLSKLRTSRRKTCVLM